MPPASVLEINIESGDYHFDEYAVKFSKKKHLLTGEEALEYAYDVFRNRVPKYFIGADKIACAVTGGWDSRTNLSFFPDTNSVVAYTYGVPGCGDLVEASKITQRMNIKHRKILFDKDFEEELPSLMFDTVFLSSGLERIARSTLLYVYKNLTDFGRRFPLVISGISGDHLFRGHGNVPAIISPDMSRIFSTGDKIINEGFWRACMGEYYEAFKKHVLEKLDNLEKNYGKLSASECHLSYMVYEVAPSHFSREIGVAKHFTTVRVPYWDDNIIELAYSIEDSTLSLSRFYRKKTYDRSENILQAYLISNNNPSLAQIPVNGYPPEIFLKGKSLYHLTRIKKLLPKAIKNRILRNRSPPLEDWNNWLSGILKDAISQLIFAEDSRIRDYINLEYIDSFANKPSDRFTSKLATVEIILRLIENKWERFK